MSELAEDILDSVLARYKKLNKMQVLELIDEGYSYGAIAEMAHWAKSHVYNVHMQHLRGK